VIQERELRAQVAEEEQLADTIEDVGLRRQAGIGSRLRQRAMTEAVEAAHRDPRPRRRADRLLDSFAKLPACLHVVREDEDLFGQERPSEGVLSSGGGGGEGEPQAAVWRQLGRTLRLEQPPDALDDDPRLARARARDDDQRTIGPLDDASLGVG
jgi:hypothetical protein